MPKVLRAKFHGSDGLFCFINICKLGSFENPFVIITSLSELYYRFKRLILLVQTKEVIYMNYGSSTSSCKLWRLVRFDLILSIGDIYINSQGRITQFINILPWNISNDYEDHPNQQEKAISSVMKWGILL